MKGYIINCTTYNNAFTGKQIGTVAVGGKVEVIPENFIKGNRTIKKLSGIVKVASAVHPSNALFPIDVHSESVANFNVVINVHIVHLFEE